LQLVSAPFLSIVRVLLSMACASRKPVVVPLHWDLGFTASCWGSARPSQTWQHSSGNVCVEKQYMASPTSSYGTFVHVIFLDGCFWLPSVFPSAGRKLLKLNAMLQARRCRRCFDMFRTRIRRNHAYRLCHVSSLPLHLSTGIMPLLNLTASCDREQCLPCTEPCSIEDACVLVHLMT
jgi:hypothetical protein